MSTSPVVTVAAFDLDRTLTTRDCVVPFLRRFSGRSAAARGALRHAPEAFAGLVRRDRNRLRKAATAAVLAGVHADDLEREAADFAAGVLAGRMRSDTTARLRWHLEQDHRVVLVSASYEVYLTHLAAGLGAHGVIGTRLELDARGRCTGRLVGANCRADEKVRRLRMWLGDAGLERDRIELWAYGDSAGDHALLTFADHPVWAAEPLASVAPTV